MAELPDITQISQLALELPQAVFNMEAQHLNEKMSTLGAEVEKLGTMAPLALPPVPGVEGLGSLPKLPGMPTETGAAGNGVPPAKEKKIKSYMEI